MDVKEIEAQIKDLNRQLVKAKLGSFDSIVGRCYEDSEDDSYSYYFVSQILSTGYVKCFYINRCFDGEVIVNPSYVTEPKSWWYLISKERFTDIWKRTADLDPFKI